MFNIFKEKPGGQIKYYGLWDWWMNTFSEDERQRIISTFQPLEDMEDSLTKGKITFSGGSATSFLSALAGWFKKESTRTIAYRMLEKAEELVTKASVSECHFLYQAKVEIYYRFRDIGVNGVSHGLIK